VAVWPRTVESLVVIDDAFWRGKRIFLTGHTGFKGAWLALWLKRMGAQVTGYALAPSTDPSLYQLADVAGQIERNHIADIRDLAALRAAMSEAQPDIVLHLAAQPLVRASYADPVETFASNVMGTTHLLESVRHTPSVRVCLVITTDKVYENREWHYPYREQDPLGGHDPYSTSKACTELVAASYRLSFLAAQNVSVATARAGNVIGGGDWSADRLVPDCVRAMQAGKPLVVRNPKSVRPWQLVLEPLAGYLQLAQLQWQQPTKYATAFNFGPHAQQVLNVGAVAGLLTQYWGDGASWELTPQQGAQVHEAGLLSLDISHTMAQTNWRPVYGPEEAIRRTVTWYKQALAATDAAAIRTLCDREIDDYLAHAAAAHSS